MKTQLLNPFDIDKHWWKVSYEITNLVLHCIQVSINSDTSPIHTFFLHFQKLTRRPSALELFKWADHHDKGRAAEVLVVDAMSSEDSCYEDDENGNPNVTNYAVRKLPWESRAMKKIKKKLDKAYRKRLSKRAKERIVTTTEAEELSERQPPNAFPEWALKETEN